MVIQAFIHAYLGDGNEGGSGALLAPPLHCCMGMWRVAMLIGRRLCDSVCPWLHCYATPVFPSQGTALNHHNPPIATTHTHTHTHTHTVPQHTPLQIGRASCRD